MLAWIMVAALWVIGAGLALILADVWDKAKLNWRCFVFVAGWPLCAVYAYGRMVVDNAIALWAFARMAEGRE